jgi:uncharacterized membrane protein
MTLHPLVTAAPLIQLHVAGALMALVLGPVALLRRSRDRWHRVAGVAWVAAMLVTAISSFGIRDTGGWSWIHILSVLTLVGLTQGLWALWRGNRAAHGAAMRALYAQALILAGVFTLLPGRRMSRALFPDAPWTGFAAIAIIGALAALWMAWPRRFPPFLRRALRLFTPASVMRMWRNW